MQDDGEADDLPSTSAYPAAHHVSIKTGARELRSAHHAALVCGNRGEQIVVLTL